MINPDFTPTMSFVFSEGMKLAKKVRWPLIGFGFLSLVLIYVPLIPLFFVIKPIISVGIFAIIPLAILFYSFYIYYFMSLSSGVTRYLHEAYNKEEASFGTFFSGFSVGHKVLWSHIVRIVLLLPLGILPTILFWDYYLEVIELMKNPLDVAQAAKLKESQPNVLAQVLVSMLSIVPQILLFYVSELVIVSKLGAWKAIVTSFNAMKKHILFFVLLFFVLGLINVLGFLLLGFGLLYTIPLTVSILYVLFNRIFLNESRNALSIEIDAFGSSQEEFDTEK